MIIQYKFIIGFPQLFFKRFYQKFRCFELTFKHIQNVFFLLLHLFFFFKTVIEIPLKISQKSYWKYTQIKSVLSEYFWIFDLFFKKVFFLNNGLKLSISLSILVSESSKQLFLNVHKARNLFEYWEHSSTRYLSNLFSFWFKKKQKKNCLFF